MEISRSPVTTEYGCAQHPGCDTESGQDEDRSTPGQPQQSEKHRAEEKEGRRSAALAHVSC